MYEDIAVPGQDISVPGDDIAAPGDLFVLEPLPSLPLATWRRAVEALRDAEERGAPHAEQLALSEDVIRSRNTLALHQLANGIRLPDTVIRDERLLSEADDAAHP
jgi:hypothetical protein